MSDIGNVAFTFFFYYYYYYYCTHKVGTTEFAWRLGLETVYKLREKLNPDYRQRLPCMLESGTRLTKWEYTKTTK